MELGGLFALFAETEYGKRLLAPTESGARLGVPRAARPFVLAALYSTPYGPPWQGGQQRVKLPVLVVAASSREARFFQDELSVWCGPATPILSFPEPDALPYEDLPWDRATVRERLVVVANLSGLIVAREPPIIVASPHALAQKTLPPERFHAASHLIEAGARLKPEAALGRWLELGYEIVPQVTAPGQASRRGGILDIFPPHLEGPVRIELMGDKVESLRSFDPATQRSTQPLPSCTVIPAREEPGEATLLQYLTSDSLLVWDEPSQIEAALQELDAQAQEMRRGGESRGEVSPGQPAPYLTYAELVAECEIRNSKLETRKPKGARSLSLESWGPEPSGFEPAPAFSGLGAFFEELRHCRQEGERVVVFSQQAQRLSELLQEEDIFASPLAALPQPPPPGSLTLLQGALAEGWRLPGVLVLSDREVFGFPKKEHRGRRASQRPVLLPQLAVGDHVVHIEHGIARFLGLEHKGLEGAEGEYLVLEYAQGDRLYVPADQVDRVTRYLGPGDYAPSLSRLGTQEWARAKERVKKATAELAQELLDLYAIRQVLPGHAFPPDTTWQHEMEAAFPYVETPDQLQAVQQVKKDMEAPRPMDRLVCGDVGYGKTEVALRAAFKAVNDGWQVAVLVPTTILAQQHFVTFTERLKAFPVRVEMLSRFRSPQEQREVVDGLAKGNVDICIGTHRLLQKDVTFKKLGLVVIDEEQRFGVAHKERLKKMRREVDVLTLTATPIPRTLHMGLAGIRDLSLMETPPEERLPIKTAVAPFDTRLVREAILREMERGGQVFFVHNRVHDIGWIASQLAESVPEARLVIAHGQMPEEVLERVMLDFSVQKCDVLVTTTIIESGLDLPNVNTLIVHDADKLGLTQLYQLRGRVGRGSQRAYAYLHYEKGKRLTDTARKRLEAIFQATELGAGFQIAMKDLEIRGAGNLLGPEQSGQIGAVGFDLYTRLLAEAVAQIKAPAGPPAPPPLPPPSIDLPLSAYIPEDWVADEATRLALYRRLAGVDSLEAVEDMAGELRDRFGALPEPARDLLWALKVRALAMKAGVASVGREDGDIVLRMREGLFLERDRLQRVLGPSVKVARNHLRLGPRPGWRGAVEKALTTLA